MIDNYPRRSLPKRKRRPDEIQAVSSRSRSYVQTLEARISNLERLIHHVRGCSACFLQPNLVDPHTVRTQEQIPNIITNTH